MADGNRPYDPNNPYAQSPQTSKFGHSGADPLTELARLIGQNDPFSEFASNPSRNPSTPADPGNTTRPLSERQPESAQLSADSHRPPALDDYGDAVALPADPQPATRSEPHYSNPQFSNPQFGNPHSVPELQSHAQHYYSADSGQVYAPEDAQEDASDDRFQHSGRQPYYRQVQSQEMDEEPAPSRRRTGLMTVVAIFALAVGGTAAALGYRAVFSSSGSGTTPPVIKADTNPSKVVPAAPAKDPNANKLIYDRVGDRSQSERVVVREEQPIEMKEAGSTAPRVTFPNPQSSPSPAVAPPMSSTAAGPWPAAQAPASASAPATTSEPKKIRTVTIRPDSPDAPVARTTAPPPPPPAARGSGAQVTGAGTAEIPAVPPPPAASASPPRQTTGRSQPAQANPNAPISLTPPSAPAPAARSAAIRPAAPALRPSTTAESGSGAFVQVASQRSEAEAQASFRAVKARFPDVLGARQAIIRRADLGDKGIYYRAQIGPLSPEQAVEMCSNLKAAGGQCLIQRN